MGKGLPNMLNNLGSTSREQTHKELMVTKTTADGQLAHKICACVRGSTSPYHQVEVNIQKVKPEDT